ncbi:MAG: 1,4-dihydroxy-2-naphthoate octaprenyltransferase [Natronomonas sp.]|jgi:1,4-dihydroxy-2-naphthoate octaprenyltransferase|uniref:UbiA family prenyltransferase n=1 Tax=Natronomonas sp. TaxID=2184060 RepID=UPI0039898461
MALARHGSGIRADVGALASQVHPVFMLPPLAASAFGAVLAGRLDVTLLALHLTAAFAALYTAHIKDGYVDFYKRGEDDDHPLTAGGCRAALAGTTGVFFVCLVAIGALVDVWAALLTLPGWVIGYMHAPQLDLNPLGATAGYPAGIAFALLGGFYVQATTLTASVVAFAAVFLLVLSGIKTIDDAKDHEYDRSIGKRTVAVVLGPANARRFAYGLMAVGMVVVVALAVVGVFPPVSAAAPVVFGVVAGFAWRAGEDDGLAAKLLIRGSYLFLAVLLVAVWIG